MIFRFTKVFILCLIGFLVFTGCERTQKVIVGNMPSDAISDTEATPVKLVWFIDYPEGGKAYYLEWIATITPMLRAPEIIRIRAYDNMDPLLRPKRMVEFEFGSFIDMATYLNRPEIAVILEDLPNRTSQATVHTFIRRSDHSKEIEGNWKIKNIYLINYPLGGKQAYLEWIASVSSTLVARDELKAIASYDNYYGETPHRLAALEFATQADAEAYEQIEAIKAIETELNTRTGGWKLHRFELSSDYINTRYYRQDR